MSRAPMSPVPAAETFACPECGREFGRRGLATHRRMCHAVGHAPKSALPEAIAIDAHVAHEIVRALEGLTRVVERIDANLERILEARAPAGAAPTGAANPRTLDGAAAAMKSALERNLDAILTEVARVRSDLECRLAEWGGRATTDEQRALEHSANQDLGRLRRQQAEVLFRLMQLGASDAALDLTVM